VKVDGTEAQRARRARGATSTDDLGATSAGDD